MKNTKKWACGALILLGSGLSNAAITLTFTDTGSTIEAVLSGSITVPNSRIQDDFAFASTTLQGTSNTLLAQLNGTTGDIHNGGSAFSDLGLSSDPDSFTGTESFGYQAGVLIVPGSAEPGTTLSPTGTFIWNVASLSAIGLGELNLTPVTVYTAANAEEIRFVSSVPEPTSSVLVGLASLGMLLRRRR